jgi:diguanylate cyclase (GGDEF)-like protein
MAAFICTASLLVTMFARQEWELIVFPFVAISAYFFGPAAGAAAGFIAACYWVYFKINLIYREPISWADLFIFAMLMSIGFLAGYITRGLKRMAQTDPLTGLLNRRAFYVELSQSWHLVSKKDSYRFALLIIDVDNFKQINDEYGHLKGDEILENTSEILRHAVRKNDVVSRWGGEEFAILIRQTDEEQAIAIAERIRQTFEKLHRADPLFPTVSIGLVTKRFNDDIKEIREMIHRADDAMYAAKSFKNRIKIASNR